MKIGDLVKMNRGYSSVGLVTEIKTTNLGMWVWILWPDAGITLEAFRDVAVVSEGR